MSLGDNSGINTQKLVKMAREYKRVDSGYRRARKLGNHFNRLRMALFNSIINNLLDGD
jgi:hypothetical protein